jgi:transcriptional regulator with XRE-family HTH domain
VEKELEQDLKARFGRAIRRRRRELDISQEVLAERADLHRTYVSDIEQGSRNPSLVNIVQLAMGLEITVARLFSEYGMEDPDEG